MEGGVMIRTDDKTILSGNTEEFKWGNSSYKGGWKEGKMHGKGSLNNLNGTWEGEWVDGKKTKGTYTKEDGTRYKGRWKTNIRGNGIITWRNEQERENRRLSGKSNNAF